MIAFQAKLDAEAAAKAARDFEEKHRLILTRGQSKPAAGLKSRAKAKAQPLKAVKPKEPAAEKGKGACFPMTQRVGQEKPLLDMLNALTPMQIVESPVAWELASKIEI